MRVVLLPQSRRGEPGRLRAGLAECLRVATEDEASFESWLKVTEAAEAALKESTEEEPKR